MKDIKTNEKIENIVYEDKKNEFPISFINLNCCFSSNYYYQANLNK